MNIDYTIDIPNNHQFFDLYSFQTASFSTMNRPRRISAARSRKSPHATWVSSRARVLW
jgi:hypothetical protein